MARVIRGGDGKRKGAIQKQVFFEGEMLQA